MNKIIVDCLGCDNKTAVIKGIAKALNEIDDVIIYASGDEKEIKSILHDENYDKSRLGFINAPEVITNNDSPVLAIRTKENSSLVQALQFLRNNYDVSALISAGSTGAVLCGSIIILGKEENVDRPTLVSYLPTSNNSNVCLTDCGANIDSRPQHLLEFATLANENVKKAFKIDNPRIGLLSIGNEDKKGNALTKEAFVLLKNSDLNFVGNVEPKNVLNGDVDVVVADGFYGNILLKTIESSAKAILKSILNKLYKHIPSDADSSFIKESYEECLKEIDFNSQGGAQILGIKKAVIKAHGSANEDTIVNCIKQAIKNI